MEMHQIRYFLAVAETRNFTRAARASGVSQPALTRAIRKLEEELGGALFERRPSGVRLTQLGRLMQPHLERTHAAALAAKSEAETFANAERQQLTLGVMCTIGPARLINLVRQLETRVPGLELKLREERGTRIVQRLIDDEVDVALVGLPGYPDEVRAEPLYRERYVVAFPPGHRFEAMRVVPVAAIDDETYLARANCEYPEFYGAHTGDFAARFNVRYESEREDWIQAMILAGLGCTFLPEYLPLFPEIRTRPLTDPEISREISLVTMRGRRFSPVLEAFVRTIKAYDWRQTA